MVLVIIILAYLYNLRRQWLNKYKQSLSCLNGEQIYRHLCCNEFPFECFYGINLAFYRTFVSPTISTVYSQTNTIASETEKRVNDTDIIMHAWIDYGLNSDEGRASMKHLNNIHGAFSNRTLNKDFVFILCCFTVDTIQIIDVFGWRHLDDRERRAIFDFYEQVGQRMNLKDRPTSLEEANIIINNYIDSDTSSRYTSQGQVLTNAIHTLVQKWYGRLLPASLIRVLLNAIIYVVGGATFHQKLGLPEPSRLLLYAVYILATIRCCIMQFVPPRKGIHHLSDNLMKKDYRCPVSKINFLQVGPPKLLQRL
ncbi:unnamed protein product [Rotaria sp. Silwood2]|nr:unnamed protein product [Rotaria sp. Silwood2]